MNKRKMIQRLLLLCVVWYASVVSSEICFAGIFDGTPKAVTVPDIKSGETVGIASIETGDKTISMELLGGTTAIPKKGAKKKKKKNVEEQIHGYTLQESKAGKEWLIKYNEKGKKATAATLVHDGNALNFKWNTKVPDKLRAPMANCVLKLTCEAETHYMALREPVRLETIVLNPKNASGSVKSQKLDAPFPSTDIMFFEILSLGNFASGNNDVIIPPTTKVTEMGPKNPLMIQFTFTDQAGNKIPAIIFNVVPTFGNNFSASILPPPESAKQLAMLMQVAQDPQVELQIANWNKEITALNAKMEKQEAWQRSAQDTAKITNLQMQIWMVSQLKSLANAEAKVRVYADYGEVQLDLVVTDSVAVEQQDANTGSTKKAGKSRKTSKKKKTEESENDFGGMKF